MTERLLQYIWQFQYFSMADLSTVEGEPLQVVHPGKINSNQGPDFTDAKIKIGSTTWVGSVELHINSSHWKTHKHSGDINYRNVVLHVVWKHDVELQLPFPTLVLEDKVPKLLLKRYEELMQADTFIACERNLHLVSSLTWQGWKERLLAERLQSKTTLIAEFLQQNNNHWEETCWWLMARNFGIKLNSLAFEQIARSLPVNILAKHKGQIHQAEALLFGQAGLLEADFSDDYPVVLQKEYRFLKKKYNLKPIGTSLVFLRMRPSNFPTVRLAQLAMLVHSSRHLFSKIKESAELDTIRDLLQVTANDYWHYHYVFDETSAFKKKQLGRQMTDNIIINTVVPLVFAYGLYNREQFYKDRAIRWLEQVNAEKNSITNGFAKLGVTHKTAFDSQALIQLKNEYCQKKRCLDCRVGNSLVRNTRQ